MSYAVSWFFSCLQFQCFIMYISWNRNRFSKNNSCFCHSFCFIANVNATFLLHVALRLVSALCNTHFFHIIFYSIPPSTFEKLGIFCNLCLSFSWCTFCILFSAQRWYCVLLMHIMFVGTWKCVHVQLTNWIQMYHKALNIMPMQRMTSRITCRILM